jgi:uncharacterized protein (TIGR02466 family)
MNNYSVTTIFPTTLAVSELGRELTKEEYELLANMPCNENQGNLTSKNSYLLELPELANLKADLMEGIQHYMDNIVCANSDVQAYITQSWVNYTGEGQYHHKHRHINSYISGVFYVSAEEEIDKINFYNDKSFEIGFTPIKWNVHNSESWWYEAKPGRLILFPSNLFHSVDRKKESNIRISLSFNTFLKGNLGEKDKLTEVIL